MTDGRVACIGGACVDFIMTGISQLPAPGKSVPARDFHMDVGGCATNIATSLAKLGIPATLFVRVEQTSPDPFWRWLCQKIAQTNNLCLRPCDISSDERCPPSVTFVLAHELNGSQRNRERTFVHYSGRADGLRLEDLRQHTELLVKHRYLVLAGMGNFMALETDANFPRFLKELCSSNPEMRIVADVVPFGPSDRAGPERVAKWLGQVHYFCPNEGEVLAVARALVPRSQAVRKF